MVSYWSPFLLIGFCLKKCVCPALNCFLYNLVASCLDLNEITLNVIASFSAFPIALPSIPRGLGSYVHRPTSEGAGVGSAPVVVSESTLPRATLRILAQLRKNKCSIPLSYLNKNDEDKQQSPLWLLCKAEPHKP